MNVLFAALDVQSGTGGMQQYCRRVVRVLEESGATATIVALRDRGSARTAAVRHVGCRRNRLGMTAAFARALLAERPEVVLIGHVLLVPLAVLARLIRPGARVVLLAYGVDVWRRPPRLRRAIVSRLVSRVVAISHTTAQRMAQTYGLGAARFTIVPPAVDQTPASAFMSGFRTHRLLTVARLGSADRDKGVERVIRAMPQIVSDFPGAGYYVAGDGPLRPEMAALASALGVTGHVHLLGRVDADGLGGLYEGCDVFVMPSSKEGFGIVYLEAWSHGLPVVAGNRDAGAEVVEDGVTGLLVDPSSTESIAAAVKRLLADPPLRRSLGEAGRRLVAERYSHAAFAESFTTVLRGDAS